MATIIYLGDRHGGHSDYSASFKSFVRAFISYLGAIVVFWTGLLVYVRPDLGAFGNYGLFQHF